MIFVGVILVCLHFACSQKPDILSASPDKDERLGGTAELWCTVRNSQTQDVIWSKKGSPIPIFSNNVTSGRYPRMSASLSLDSKTGIVNTTLKIKDVNHTDAGDYECGVLHGQEMATSRRIALRVQYPPVIVNSADSAVKVSKNNPGKLECNFTGYPNPTVTWNRENNAPLPTGDVTHNGTFLVIANASREFAGIYYCKAENSVGESTTKKFIVKVEYGPEIQVNKPRVGQALNFNATLECSVWALPQADVQWFHNGARVSLHQHIKNEIVAAKEDLVISTLTITAVERSYYGNYSCQASVDGKNAVSAFIEFFETDDVQCAAITCGSSLDQPDFKLLISTTVIVAAIFVRW